MGWIGSVDQAIKKLQPVCPGARKQSIMMWGEGDQGHKAGQRGLRRWIPVNARLTARRTLGAHTDGVATGETVDLGIHSPLRRGADL